MSRWWRGLWRENKAELGQVPKAVGVGKITVLHKAAREGLFDEVTAGRHLKKVRVQKLGHKRISDRETARQMT